MNEREIPLAAELEWFSGENDGPISSFFFHDWYEFSHFTTLIFCSLIQVFFSFTAVRLNLLFTRRGQRWEKDSICRNASPCDFLPNDFYGIVKMFFFSSLLSSIKEPSEWWKHKLCCSTQKLLRMNEKKGFKHVKVAVYLVRSILIHCWHTIFL